MAGSNVGILSLGCPRNLSDSEAILGRLQKKGYHIVDIDKADTVLINTCAFTQEAKEESIEAIIQAIALKKEKKIKRLIIHGCLAQRYKAKLARLLPEVDAFVGTVSLNHDAGRYPLTPAYYAYLKICEGCVNACSYCVIPSIKGRFTSLDAESIVRKAAALDASGIMELNIIGQDISGYGLDIDGKLGLARVVKSILKAAPHVHWVRLLYLNPLRVTDELIELIAGEERICKYVDVPIQHCSDRILKLMNRQTTKSGMLTLLKKLRKKIPQVAVRTAVITGFPSETDKEFREMLAFIKECRFERLGAFMYSREEGTVAYSLKPQVSKAVKQKRFNAIMQAQQAISEKVNQRYMGSTLEILLEDSLDTAANCGKLQKGHMQAYAGRSQFDAPEVDGTVYVYAPRGPSGRKPGLRPGDIVKATITDTMEYDLVGQYRAQRN